MERTAGAIGMWQSRAPFVAGFLLTCAAAAVAAQTAEPPRQSQSVKEFVRLAEIEGQSETGSAAAAAQVSTARASGSGGRPVTAVSLVDLVARAGGRNRPVTRISPGELVTRCGREPAAPAARGGDRNGSVTRISLVELVTRAGHETAAPVAPGSSTVEVASAEVPSRIRDESTSAAGDATAPKPLPSTAAPVPAAASKRA